MYLEDKRAFINNDIMSLLRQTRALSIGHMKEPSIYINDYMSTKMKSKWNINIKEMIDHKKYDDLFRIMLGILGTELENFVSPIHKDSKHITKMIISEMLSIQDQYKWYDVISKVIRECFAYMSSEINVV
jgi:hypothetical protein